MKGSLSGAVRMARMGVLVMRNYAHVSVLAKGFFDVSKKCWHSTA